MLTIGLITLDDAPQDELIPRGYDWTLVPILLRKSTLRRALAVRRYTAIAIVGLGLDKVKLATDALLLGKHVLIDFPPGQNPKEAARLLQIAQSKGLGFYSPNLIKTKPGLQELRNMASRPDARLLSLTITCGLSAQLKRAQYSMKLSQLIDLVEWIADSRCTSIFAERSLTKPGKAGAYVVLASVENGVRVLCNLYLAPAKTHRRFWVDAIFDDSIVHVAPDAQSLKVDYLHNSTSKNVDWSRSPQARVLDEFSTEAKNKRQSLDLEHLRRISELVDCAFRK